VPLWNPSGYHALTDPGYHAPNHRAITPQDQTKTPSNQRLTASVKGPSQDWGCDGGRVFSRPFSDRGWMRGLGFEAGGNRG